jgi:hypothetical protein
MYHQPLNLDIELPAWIEEFAQSYTNTPDIHERMAFVISAAERSVLSISVQNFPPVSVQYFPLCRFAENDFYYV